MESAAGRVHGWVRVSASAEALVVFHAYHSAQWKWTVYVKLQWFDSPLTPLLMLASMFGGLAPLLPLLPLFSDFQCQHVKNCLATEMI